MPEYVLEEINNVGHPKLFQAIAMIKRRLKPGQTPSEKAFLNALANKKNGILIIIICLYSKRRSL